MKERMGSLKEHFIWIARPTGKPSLREAWEVARQKGQLELLYRGWPWDGPPTSWEGRHQLAWPGCASETRWRSEVSSEGALPSPLGAGVFLSLNIMATADRIP